MNKVFISYSHQDEAWKERVISHLGVLAREGRLEVWDDRRIAGGDDWRRAIEDAIQTCSAALLLISRHSLNSEFILEKEVPPLLEASRTRSLRLIPVIVGPCAWTEVDWLKGIQARPKDGTPLASMSEHAVDEVLAELAKEVLRLLGPPSSSPERRSVPPEKISLDKLPQTGADFLGRELELHLLDDAWADAGRTHLVEFVAPGGTGKTALVSRWLERLKAGGWGGARRVYAWSFYSQGTSEDRQASEDPFLAEALKWFEVEHDPALSPADKGRLLAEALMRERTLLILDGVEPLQYSPGPLAGRLRAPGLQTLLRQLARAGHTGLCVLTTREAIADLEEHRRSDAHPTASLVSHDLGNLSDADGARLLHRLGVRHAGAANIGDDDAELRAASHEVRGHALALTLLGKYLTLSTPERIGDIRQRDLVNFEDADAEVQGHHARKVMAAYERWLGGGGDRDQRALAVVRLLGLFDRPADAGCIVALRKRPPIAGLTGPLVDLTDAQWNLTVARLAECGLVLASSTSRPAASPSQNASLDAHPLVREYFAAQLHERNPDAWREGHRRLYEHLKDSVPYQPDVLDGLQPLYQAVAHGCLAGLHQDACDKVYFDRINRMQEFYGVKKLGAFGVDLGAVACFFDQPWTRLSSNLRESDQAWLLGVAAFNLRALGRLTEALEPMRAGLPIDMDREDWRNAAIRINNLSELELTLGDVVSALRDAEQAETFADRSGDAVQRMTRRTTHADALHHAGRRDEALALFREAEQMQVELQPEYPLLYALQGFQYCDLLLTEAERAAWRGLESHLQAVEPDSLQRGSTESGVEDPSVLPAKAGTPTDTCDSVSQRATQTLRWVARQPDVPLLTVAMDHLTLGRAPLYQAILDGSAFRTPPSALQAADLELAAAMDGLRAAAMMDHLPSSLLTRAWLRVLEGDVDGARADLNEAWQIAERGSMKLHMADVHLHRARLFRDKAELAKAGVLIRACGYGRRKEELEDAEAAAKRWPDSSSSTGQES